MTETNNNNNTNEVIYKPTIEDEWLIRPCCVYEEEYSDCTSLKARFHQYFIFGKMLDCSQWKRDANNCENFIENQNIKAGEMLVKSEKTRRLERLKPHYANDTWQKRKIPPKDWNQPLPESFQKEYENSYLNIKAKELRGEIPLTTDPSNVCCIM